MFVVKSIILTLWVSVTYIVIIIAPDRMRCQERTYQNSITQQKKKRAQVWYFLCLFFLLFFLHQFRFGEKQTITMKIGSKEGKKRVFNVLSEMAGNCADRKACMCEWKSRKTLNIEHWNKAMHINTCRTSQRINGETRKLVNRNFLYEFCFFSFVFHPFLDSLLLSTSSFIEPVIFNLDAMMSITVVVGCMLFLYRFSFSSSSFHFILWILSSPKNQLVYTHIHKIQSSI